MDHKINLWFSHIIIFYITNLCCFWVYFISWVSTFAFTFVHIQLQYSYMILKKSVVGSFVYFSHLVTLPYHIIVRKKKKNRGSIWTQNLNIMTCLLIDHSCHNYEILVVKLKNFCTDHLKIKFCWRKIWIDR